MKKQTKTILFIEDNEDILEAVQLLLEDAGYMVIGFADDDYLNKLDEHSLPDIILLDMLLSGKDGRDIVRSIKKNKVIKHIPVILTSAHPNAKNLWRESGANDFIAKPFTIEDLKIIIAKNIASN